MLADLEPPPIAPEWAYLWGVFLDLHTSRASGMNGPSGISYMEIGAYAMLYDIAMEPFEIEAIRALDRAFLGTLAD